MIISLKKKIRASTGFEPVTSALPFALTLLSGISLSQRSLVIMDKMVRVF